MKDYMLRLVIVSPFTGDWEMKFREYEDKQSIDSAVKHLSVIGNSHVVVGAQLFRLEPTGTIKEFIPIFIFEVAQRVVIKDAHFAKQNKVEESKPDPLVNHAMGHARDILKGNP